MYMQATSGSSGASVGEDAHPLKDLAVTPEALFTVIDQVPYLKGSTSRSSGCHAFPARDVCPNTGARDMEPQLFGPLGSLYSYTAVHVSATRETPYAIGYVDFPQGLRALLMVRSQAACEGRLPCDSPVMLQVEGDRVVAVPVEDTQAQQQGEQA